MRLCASIIKWAWVRFLAGLTMIPHGQKIEKFLKIKNRITSGLGKIFLYHGQKVCDFTMGKPKKIYVLFLDSTSPPQGLFPRLTVYKQII